MLEILKELVSNEMEVMCLKVAELDSRMPMEPRLVSRSVPHENWPDIYASFWVVPLQVVRPPPW